MAESFDRVAIARFARVEEHAGPQQSADAVDLRAVRVFRGFNFGVMLPMDGYPLLGHHARGEPKPEPEKMADRRVEIQRAMGLMPVQVYRD
jgi:hypothetical protein